MLKLGDITLDVPFFQASLSGYTDYAMRRLARDFGAPLTFTGVILAKSAAHPGLFEKRLFRPGDDEHPVGAQILGSEPAQMARAARALKQAGYDLVDINLACPAPKVLRKTRGGALLEEPDKALDIVRAVREAVDCPVLVKLRAGFDSKPASQEKFRKIVSGSVAAGIDAVVVHTRTVRQRFRGKAEPRIVAELKRDFPEAVIIGSGDMFEPQGVIEFINQTGADGVAVARGAIGNPWVFTRLRVLLDGNPDGSRPSLEEQRQTILRHIELLLQLYEPLKAIRHFRKFLVYYCKLHPHRKKAQKQLLAASDVDELRASIDRCYSAD